MRTNEEFLAEVYRRRDDEMKNRKVRKKRIINALVCLPLCTAVAFIALSLAIAMQPAGSADKNANKSEPACPTLNTGAGERETELCEDEEKAKALLSLFAKIEVRTPKESGFESTPEKGCYSVRIGRKLYFVCESYMAVNSKCFEITTEEFTEFLDIMEGRYYEN